MEDDEKSLILLATPLAFYVCLTWAIPGCLRLRHPEPNPCPRPRSLSNRLDITLDTALK